VAIQGYLNERWFLVALDCRATKRSLVGDEVGKGQILPLSPDRLHPVCFLYERSLAMVAVVLWPSTSLANTTWPPQLCTSLAPTTVSTV